MSHSKTYPNYSQSALNSQQSTKQLNKTQVVKGRKKSIFGSKISTSNVNDIAHFISQKNSTPQTNILWAQTLRKQVDHQQMKAKIDKIPQKEPRVYEDAFEPYRRKVKDAPCPADVQYIGNVAEYKQTLKTQGNTVPQKENVEFLLSLRQYNMNPRQIKTFNRGMDKGYTSSMSEQKISTIRNKIDRYNTDSSKEKNWTSLPKLDKKEYFNLNEPQCKTIKEGIHYNNSNKHKQFKGFTGNYLSLPKYSEKFGEKNSTNFRHFKGATNSTLSWTFGLRDYR